MGLSMVQIREAVREEIAQQMQATASKLTSGRALDFAEYRAMVGRIAGNREAMDAVDKVFKKFFNDDMGDEG